MGPLVSQIVFYFLDNLPKVFKTYKALRYSPLEVEGRPRYLGSHPLAKVSSELTKTKGKKSGLYFL